MYDNKLDSSLDKDALVIELGGISKNSQTISIMTPKEAYAIDSAIDDGKPNSGVVRTDNGDGQACIANGEYNLSNTNLACVVRFIIRNNNSGGNLNTSGYCTKIGDIRESPDPKKRCPVGYQGRIMESCLVNLSTGSGLWTVSKKLCNPVKCEGNKNYGERRVVGCSNGQVGKGIVEECSQYGNWQEITALADCTTPTGKDGGVTCDLLNSVRGVQACSWNRGGKVLQSCKTATDSLTYWTTDTNGDSCSLIKCDSSNVGMVRAASTSRCGNNYLGVDGESGKFAVSEACVMDGTWQVVSNECAPQYGACNLSVDSTRDIGCPPGETGTNTQICSGTAGNSYWISGSNNCKKVTCSGQPVGSVRLMTGVKCTSGVGMMLEVCHDDGNWVSTTNNCTPLVCSGAGNADGNAVWPNSNAGTSGVSAKECAILYRTATYPNGTLPTRNCSANAIWGDTSNDCVRIQCSPEVSDNARFPATGNAKINSGPDDITGQCLFGYTNSTSGAPTKQCSPDGAMNSVGDGTWSNLKNPCVETTFSGPPTRNLSLWFDAAEATSLVSNDDCNSGGQDVLATSGEQVACWYDKSNNRLKLYTQPTIANKPILRENFLNGLPVLQFDGSMAMSLTPIAALLSPDHYSEAAIVLKEDSNVSTPRVFYSQTDNTGSGYIYGIQNGSVFYNFPGFSGATRTVTDPGKFYVYTLQTQDMPEVNSGAEDSQFNESVYINGSLIEDISKSYVGFARDPYNYSDITVGGILNPNGSFFVGEIAEIIAYNAQLTSGEINQLNSYLLNKWGISTVKTPPGSVTKGLNFWLDAQDSDTLHPDTSCSQTIRNADSIGCWQDKAVNKHFATIDTGAPPPIYQQSGAINSRPSIYTHLGSGYGYLKSINLNGVDETDFAISLVYNPDSFQVNYIPVLLGQATSAANVFRYGVGNSNVGNVFIGSANITSGSISIQGLATGSTVVSPGTNNIITAIAGGGTTPVYNIYNNGALWASSSSSPEYSTYGGTDSQLYIAGAGSGKYFDGSVGEILLYNRGITNSERLSIEADLAAKWGIGVLSCATDSSLTIKSGLTVWYDATDVDCDGNSSNEPATGDKVAVWRDKSTSNHDASVSDVTYAPSYYKTSAINNMPALSFSSGQYSSTAAMTLAGNNSIIMILDSTSTQSANLWASSTDSQNIKLLYQGVNIIGQIGGGSASSSAYYSNTPAILSYIYSEGSSSKIYINGHQGTAGSSPYPNIDTNSVSYNIASSSGGSSSYSGLIGEVLVYNQALSEEDRITVESYLSNKWGIAVNECVTDNSLPYKTNLSIWLDANDVDCQGNESHNYSNSATITTWADKKNIGGENFYNATAPSGREPYMMFDISNSKAALMFASNVNGQSYMTTPSFSMGNANSLFITFEMLSGGNQDIFGASVTLGEQIYTRISITPNSVFSQLSDGINDHGTSTKTAIVQDGKFHVISNIYSYANAAYNLYIDASQGSFSSGVEVGVINKTDNNVRMIGLDSSGNRPFHGYIGEIIAYNEQLSDGNRRLVENYLANKWGATLACVSDTFSGNPSASLVLWYDATDVYCDKLSSSQPSNGSSIVTWRDKSGSHQELLNSAQVVKYSTGSFNSNPAIEFTASSLSTTAYNTISNNYSLYMVASVSDLTSSKGLFNIASSTGLNIIFYNNNTGIRSSVGGINLDNPASMIVNTPYIIEYSTDGTNMYSKVIGNNNVSSVQMTMPSGGFTNYLLYYGNVMTIGSISGSGDFTGKIAEVIGYDKFVTGSEQSAIESYLEAKWGVTAN